MFTFIRSFAAAALLIAIVSAAPAARAATAFGTTSANNLVRFNTATPGTTVSTTPITGLQPGETILGIDFRPVNGVLYGLGSTSRIYIIDVASGVATAVNGTQFTPALSGAAFGFDFNPTSDRIRITSDLDQNLRIDPNTGIVTNTDPSLAYATGDPNFGSNPSIRGVAYTSNNPGATTTTLHGIDLTEGCLVTQNPTSGTLTTVGAGSLGFVVVAVHGFDIEGGTNTAFAALSALGDLFANLYTINLTTGVATQVGAIGPPINSLAIVPDSFTAEGAGNTVTFTGTDAGRTLIFDFAGGLLRHNRFSAGDSAFNSDFDFDSTVPGDQTLSATDSSTVVFVTMGSRDDRVIIGRNPTVAGSIAANFIIDGLGGGDQLIIDDAAATAGRTVDITDDAVLGFGGVILYKNIERLTVNCGSGDDRVTVQSTSAQTVVNAGDGSDTIAMRNGVTLLGGHIDGGAGINTLDYSAYGAAYSFNPAETQNVFLAILSGQQEPGPLSSSSAFGIGTFVLDATQTALSFTINYKSLTGTSVSGAHFHNAAAGVNGPIVRGLTPAEEGAATIPAGNLSSAWLAADTAPLTPALVTELLAGRVYFNIHTAPLFPSGEIRGQLIPQGTFGTATGTAGARLFTPNAAPVFLSEPVITPNPATVGNPVKFIAAALDNEPVTYAWNFGDATTAPGAAVMHTYSAAGAYNVIVIATDIQGTSKTANATLVVTNPSTPPFPPGTLADADGDGFSDNLETAAGTAPNDIASTPLGGAPAPAPLPLPDVKLAIKLNFAKAASDTIALSGTLLLSQGFDVSGKAMLFEIGNIARALQFDAKGAVKSANLAAKLTSKGRGPRTAKFSIKLSKGDFDAGLAAAGLVNATVSADVSVPVSVFVDGKLYQTLQLQSYKATQGKSGATKDKK